MTGSSKVICVKDVRSGEIRIKSMDMMVNDDDDY